jgi:protein-tyrosine-phosphatase
MCVDADVVFCMTCEQRDRLAVIAPGATGRTVCLDPDAAVPDPSGRSLEAYVECATRLRTLVRRRLRDLRERYAQPAVEEA